MRFLLLIFSFFLLYQGFSQENSISQERKLADSLLNSGEYQSALPLYEKLLSKFPKDPYYNYASGVCLLHTSKKLDKSIELLKKASTSDVPVMVYFYLAEAHRLSYRFTDAIDYYRRFTINGGSDQVNTDEVEKLVSICENGNFMLRYLYTLPVIDKKRVPQSEFYKYFSIEQSKGSFIPKPDDLKTSNDKKQNETSVIFYPQNPSPGDYIYFSGYSNSTSYGKDIFRTQFKEDGYWSKPENLGDIINSSLDEDFPYFHTNGYLYFASKGHYSIGGYDLYRSAFDPKTKKLTTPENLGFPINSTFDDILYIPEIRDSLAFFATNRNATSDSIEIILARIEDNPVRKTFTSVSEAIKIAELPLNSTKAKQVEEVGKEVTESKNAQKEVAKTASFNAVENDPEYMRVITKGFSEQAKADSLRIKLEKLRSGFDYITTAEERKKLESKVVKVEDDLLAAQHEADNMFARASQIEQEYLTGKRKAGDVAASSFINDNPEYLYQAQFASTVFRSDEIQKLSTIEKIQPQIAAARDNIQVLKNKLSTCLKSASDSITPDCSTIQKELFSKMELYSSVFKQLYDVKYKIYSECIMVALGKSGNSNIEAKAEIDRANTHFRAATSIINNLSDDGRIEGVFEASTLRELGILRIELAFSRIWGMTLFEQQTTSKTLKLEKFAFGNPLPSVVEKKQKEIPDEVQSVKKDEIKIEKTQTTSTIQPILFQPDEPLPFEIVEVSPYNVQNPIPIDEPFPSGVFYKIQLAAFSNPVQIDYFKGMIPVSGERVKGKVVKYYVGKFRYYTDAEKALSMVKTKGFKDAFIASWLDGKSIAATRAQTMEGKPVTASVSINAVQDSSLVSKIYLVQFGKFAGKMPDDISRTVKALAPGKDIVRKSDNQGKFIYSISSFSNVEDANRVKENLIASGIRNVTVIIVEVNKK